MARSTPRLVSITLNRAEYIVHAKKSVNINKENYIQTVEKETSS
ncbi:41107_t:CDS:1, partial [Gigaspora margarita]